MSDVRWADLELVVAIAQAGGAFAAAKQLGISQSTVSRRLAGLERRVSVVLFDRRGQTLQPTAAARELLEVATTFGSALDHAVARVRGRSEEPAGTVRLSGLRPILRLVLPNLHAVLQAHPSIELHIDASARLANVHQQEADIVIRASAKPAETLVGRRVGRVAYCLYRPRDGAPSSKVIGFPPPRGDLADAAWLPSAVPDAIVSTRIADDELQRDAVKAGLGAAQLLCLDADRDPALVRVANAPIEFGEPLWLLTHPHLRQLARIRLVMEALTAGLTEHKALIEGELRAQ